MEMPFDAPDSRDLLQQKSLVESAATEGSTTRGACDFSPNDLHAMDLNKALRALIRVTSFDGSTRQRQLMSWFLSANSQLCTGMTPLWAMGINATSSDSLLRDQVGELMKQGAFYLLRTDVRQQRIQLNASMRPKSSTCRRSHAGIPENGQFLR